MTVKVNPLVVNAYGSWSELVIERATRAHRRNFTCVANNKAALAERQVQLLVDYKPTLLLNLESREVSILLFYISLINKQEQKIMRHFEE